MDDKPAWTVRTGKYGERDEWALSNGLCGGGWLDVPDLTSATTREAITDLVRAAFPTEKPSAISNYAGQLWALRNRIQVGDLIVLPLKTTSQIALGTVTKPYSYLVTEPDTSRRHAIGVDWKRTDVPRTAIKQDLLFSLGAFLTVFQTQRHDAAWRFGQVLETGLDPGSRAGTPAESLVEEVDAEGVTDDDVASTTQLDLTDYSLTRIQTLIQERFAGHDLARLVEAVLVSEGFLCERMPPGPDGGVDILAGCGALGLDEPRLVVQVKSEPKAVGDAVVQSLQGAITRFNATQALLVAWGGVTRQAARFLETEKFSVRVWNADDLMRAIFRTYPSLAEEIRKELPLKQIWIPVE